MAGAVALKRILFVVTEDWYFVSHRLHLARAALAAGYRVALLCRLSCHRATLEQQGVEVFPWSIERRSRHPWREVQAVRDVLMAVRRFHPDLIHAVALKPVLYAAVAATWAGFPNRVFALGGLGFVFSSSRRLAFWLRPVVVQVMRWALAGKKTRLVLQNPDDRQVLLTAKVIDSERICLIRGAGVDTRAFCSRPETAGIPLVVLPARMLWDKGVGEFAECARRLRSRGVIARFVLVGDRDDHNPECVPEEQLRAWVDAGILEWWGRRDDMPAVLHGAHVVCLPSYREGLPKALLEAASCARPIVTFDVPGCREIVANGENGFLVPFGDIAGLASAIEMLLADHDLRRRMGEAGREKVLGEFSEEQVATETLGLWGRLLACDQGVLQ